MKTAVHELPVISLVWYRTTGTLLPPVWRICRAVSVRGFNVCGEHKHQTTCWATVGHLGGVVSEYRSVSYLLREVMCSSDSPPSSSLMMNSLSFSSPGCTGKLLRKMSTGRVDSGKRQHPQWFMKAFLLTDCPVVLRCYEWKKKVV